MDNREYLFKIFHNKYEMLGEGATRIVFKGRYYVIKFPKDLDGDYNNEYESCISGDEYPKTRIKYILGIPILLMQRLINIDEMEIDMGVDIKGNLKYYDYGPIMI